MHMRQNRRKRALTMSNLQHVGVDLRVAVLVKSSGHCWYCGTLLTLATLTADHIVAVKNGGSTALENLVACCKPCNVSKGCQTLEAFRRLRGVELFWGEKRCREARNGT